MFTKRYKINDPQSTMRLLILIYLTFGGRTAFPRSVDAVSANLNLKELELRSEIVSTACQNDGIDCQDVLTARLADVNDELMQLNSLSADFAWRSSVREESTDPEEGPLIDKLRIKWRKAVCDTFSYNFNILEESQRRQIYLLCRDITFTEQESLYLSITLNDMQNIYTATKVCIPKINATTDDQESLIVNYLKKVQLELDGANLNISDAAVWRAAEILGDGRSEETTCLSGEPDLERIMAVSRNEKVLKWSWLIWRQAVGPPMRPLFQKMVQIQNEAAKRHGYHDYGQVWREELEMPDLIQVVHDLYDDVKDLYMSLHGVVRYFLNKHYRKHDNKGLLEAHIAGNMWTQNWETVLNLILPITSDMDLNKMIKKTNWSSVDMVKRAEDYYTSMGLNQMSDKFWTHSYFGNDKESKEIKCHGTAANMFQPEDYRMIYCAGLSMEDFYVIHHEMGHIQYYMSYKRGLPTIFQDGTNSAFQESVGDAIMLGVMAPQHLERLGLINDKLLYKHSDTLDFDEVLLLRQALTKIPQIPFGYLVDKYRWDIFSGEIHPEDYNEMFWNYVRKHQGVEPPNGIGRNEEYFDAGAKFHIPDNTPYIRYFLSGFLQMQMFDGMCRLSLFGIVDDRVLPMPLHRCDMYGSKKAGRKLKEMMSKGRSIHWTEALHILTGKSQITSTAFLQYFAPLKLMLNRLIIKYNINIGWDYE